MLNINYKKLIASIIICLTCGIIGSLFTSASVNSWYLNINKPSFNPPNWIFGPVWTGLFILMGISLYLIWQKGINKNNPALIIFSIQYVLNIAWSFFFFYLQNPLAGLIEIIILWIFIILTIYYFYLISKTAAYLLLPYLIWVSFASILNFMLYYLN